jgi:hypothetical protein
MERFGRKPTAVTAFLLTAIFGLLWANAGSEGMVLAIGFGMIFSIPAGGKFFADLHLRGVPDQRPRLRLRALPGRRSCRSLCGDPVLPVTPLAEAFPYLILDGPSPLVA